MIQFDYINFVQMGGLKPPTRNHGTPPSKKKAIGVVFFVNQIRWDVEGTDSVTADGFVYSFYCASEFDVMQVLEIQENLIFWGCFNTPLEHTPKPLPTGYKGIPFIIG